MSYPVHHLAADLEEAGTDAVAAVTLEGGFRLVPALREFALGQMPGLLLIAVHVHLRVVEMSPAAGAWYGAANRWGHFSDGDAAGRYSDASGALLKMKS